MTDDPVAARLVDALHREGRVPPGCRAHYSRGIIVEGVFRPTLVARTLSTAEVFDGLERTIVARFSVSNEDMDASAKERRPFLRGFALRIGSDPPVELIGHSVEAFPASNPEELLALFEAREAVHCDPSPSERPPASKPAPAMVQPTTQAAAGFLDVAYHMMHAYRLDDHEGRATFGRIRVIPVGRRYPWVEPCERADRIAEELQERVWCGRAQMALILERAAPADPLDDISASWSGRGGTFVLGRLILTRLPAEQEQIKPIRFDPGRLAPGLSFAGDPMIRTRQEVYRLAAERRLASTASGYHLNRYAQPLGF